MQKKELKIELDKLHVPPSLYRLEGDIKAGSMILYNSYSDLVVFFIDEKGGRGLERTFKSEADACEYIFHNFKQGFNFDLRDRETISFLLKRAYPYIDNLFKKEFFTNLEFKFPTDLKSFYNYYKIRGTL